MMFLNFVTLWAGVVFIMSACLWSGTTGQSDTAADCCLTTRDRQIPKKAVISFTIQTGDGACRIPATVFVTRKGFKLCSPFPSESSWVRELIDAIIARRTKKLINAKGKKYRQQ